MTTRPVSVRLTDEERIRYQQAAGDKSLSAWLRELADRAAPPPDRQATEVRCTEFRHTGPFQRLGYMTRCGGCGQAVR